MDRDIEKSLKKVLGKKNLCYVLITCDAPADDGKMHVQMSYDGDATLAAYLVQGAQGFIDDQMLDNNLSVSQEKIHYFK